MKYIFEAFEKYSIKYNVKERKITLKGPVYVEDFVTLRKLLKSATIEVTEIEII